MDGHWSSIFDEDLAKVRSGNLASFDESVWDEEAERSIRECPALSEALPLGRSRRDQNISLTGHLFFNSSSEFLFQMISTFLPDQPQSTNQDGLTQLCADFVRQISLDKEFDRRVIVFLEDGLKTAHQ